MLNHNHELADKLFLKKLLADNKIEPKLRNSAKITLSLNEIIQISKTIEPISYETLITNLQNDSKNEPLVINSGWKSDLKEAIMLAIKYHQFREEFEIISLPTWSEIDEFTELLNKNLHTEVVDRILNLTQPQSVTLINNILSYDKLDWIKNFKLSPKAHDDEGRDFSATITIKRDKSEIALDGYGKMFDCIGQLKHLQDEMGPGDMRDFVGAMKNAKKKVGFVISTNGFTSRSMDAARSSKFQIICHDVNFLATLIVQYGIGLKTTKIKNGKIFDEDWWNEIRIFS